MKSQTYILCLLSFLVLGCTEDLETTYNVNYNDTAQTRTYQENGEVFYYYGIENQKILLDKVTDRVFVKFAPTASKEQFLSIADRNASSRSLTADLEERFVEGVSFNRFVIEGALSPEDIVSLKAKQEVVSATHLLEINGSQMAYTDEILIKLKDGTSLSIAETGCRI